MTLSIKDTKKIRAIIRRNISQGPEHERNIIEVHKILLEEARREFREDNRPTLLDFMHECYAKAIKELWRKL